MYLFEIFSLIIMKNENSVVLYYISSEGSIPGSRFFELLLLMMTP